jgi:type IV pilus assembly protein PilF
VKRGVQGGLTLLLLLATILLAACAGTSTGGEAREIRTASDLTDNDRRARVRMELAAGYFGRGQFTTALDEVKLALVARPDLPEAFNLRGLIYAAMNEPALAEESFQRAMQLAPRDNDTMQNYGWFMCQQRRYPEADAMFERALASPQNREVSRTLLAQGVCQARAGKLRDAERTLSRALELDTANPVITFNLSDVLYRLGELERARFYIGRLNASAELSSAQTLWLAARIEHRAGNSPGAAIHGRRLLERFPQSPEALQFERGRFDD